MNAQLSRRINVLSNFEKLETSSHIMNFIINYLELTDYVKMNQLNTKFRYVMNTKFGVDPLFTQYCTFLNTSSMKQEDMEMYRRYAIRLATQSITLDRWRSIINFNLPTGVAPNEVRERVYAEEVPAVIFVSTINRNARMAYTIQMNQWKCSGSRATSAVVMWPRIERTYMVTFVPKTEDTILTQIHFQYKGNTSCVPFSVHVYGHKNECYVLFGSGSDPHSKYGYYQEGSSLLGKIILFYDPFPKCISFHL